MKEVFEAIAQDYVATIKECYNGDFTALSFQEYLITGLGVIESDGYVQTAIENYEDDDDEEEDEDDEDEDDI